MKNYLQQLFSHEIFKNVFSDIYLNCPIHLLKMKIQFCQFQSRKIFNKKFTFVPWNEVYFFQRRKIQFFRLTSCKKFKIFPFILFKKRQLAQGIRWPKAADSPLLEAWNSKVLIKVWLHPIRQPSYTYFAQTSSILFSYFNFCTARLNTNENIYNISNCHKYQLLEWKNSGTYFRR